MRRWPGSAHREKGILLSLVRLSSITLMISLRRPTGSMNDSRIDSSTVVLTPGYSSMITIGFLEPTTGWMQTLYMNMELQKL
jgi:hypothetical protein